MRIEDGSLFCVYDDNSESAVFLFAVLNSVFVCFFRYCCVELCAQFHHFERIHGLHAAH